MNMTQARTEKMDAKREQIAAKLSELKAKAKEAGADAKITIQRQIEDLQQRLDMR